MEEIRLQNIPNQSFKIVRDGILFEIHIRFFRGIIYATVNKNSVRIITSERVVNNQWILPYPSDWSDCGNFRIECDSEEYPSYPDFGTSCKMIYYTHDEVLQLL